MCSKNLKKLVFSLVMATGLGFLAGTCVGGGARTSCRPSERV